MSNVSELSDREEVEVEVDRVQRRRFTDRQNYFRYFSDEEFKARFRFKKATVMELLHLFGHELEALAGRNEPISPLNQILITLRFYATGAFQQLLGDHNKIAKSTTSPSEVACSSA